MSAAGLSQLSAALAGLLLSAALLFAWLAPDPTPAPAMPPPLPAAPAFAPLASPPPETSYHGDALPEGTPAVGGLPEVWMIRLEERQSGAQGLLLGEKLRRQGYNVQLEAEEEEPPGGKAPQEGVAGRQGGAPQVYLYLGPYLERRHAQRERAALQQQHGLKSRIVPLERLTGELP